MNSEENLKVKMFMYVFDIPIKYLSLTGIWIDKNTSRPRILLSILSHSFFIDISMLFVIINMFTVKRSIVEYSAAMEMIPFFVGLFTKTLNIMYKKQKIEKLMESLKDLMGQDSWIEKSKGVKLQKRVEVVNKIFKYSLSFLVITSFINPIVCIARHELPVKMWLPYDYSSNEFLYWFSFSHEFIGGLIFMPVLIICDILPNFFICFAIGIAEELNERLKNVLKDEVKTPEGSSSEPTTSKVCNQAELVKKQQNEHLKEFQRVIELQLKLKTFVAEVEQIFGTILGTEALMSVSVLCTTCFALSFVTF